MEFILKQKELVKALNIVERGLGPRNVVESLNGIKIVAKNNNIIFIVSKTDLSIEYSLHTNNIIEEGAVIALGQEFINIVKKIGEPDTEIKVKLEDRILTLKTNKSKVDLVTLDINEYPEIKFGIENDFAIIEKSVLRKIYNKTKYTTSKKNKDTLQSAINLNFTQDNLIAASTDSNRLSYVLLDPISNFNTSVCIPKSSFSDIDKILDIIDDKTVKFALVNKKIELETPQLKIKSKAFEGEYPDVENTIPRNINYSFSVENDKLLAALEKVKSLATTENSLITIESINKELIVKFYVKEFGGIEEKVEIHNIIGNPYKMGFDLQFVIDALHSISDYEVKFGFSAETAPFKITSKMNENNIQIISPIRIS